MKLIDTLIQDIADYFLSTTMTTQELAEYEARCDERIMNPTHFQEFWPIYLRACPMLSVLGLGFLFAVVLPA